jgi:DNA repair protein RecO (recombination protein O)
MIHKTKGIVLHYIKYGETSIIAHIYTRDFGRQSYIVQGVRKKRATLNRNLFSPLMILNMEVYHKDKRDLQRIKEVSPIIYFNTIPFNIKKSTIAVFIAEMLSLSLKEEVANNTLFDFLTNAIQILDTENNGYVLFHHLFLIQLTKHLGFFPACREDGQNNYFDMRDGIFRLAPPSHQNYLNPELSGALLTLMQNSFRGLHALNFDHGLRENLLNKILEYYDLHKISIGKIKTLQVLKDIFND